MYSIDREKILNRFLTYVKIDTQSDPESNDCPSTSKQMELAQYLKLELERIGMEDVTLDENAYLMATLKGNIGKKPSTIGFIAHMDTSPDMSGENVNPKIVEDYDGNTIHLNKHIALSPEEFPELLKYVGQTLVTTDGNTLLGADDKAGIAEIVTAMEYMVKHPEIKHGDIRIGFTPDEEIGRGADRFNVQKFNAEFAYTLDGSEIGELEFENFNAAFAKIVINGRNVHPGTAKDKMINSILVATELNSILPLHQRPEYTEKYEGFFHLIDFIGSVEESKLQYIIRDHDRDKFEAKKDLFRRSIDFINQKYGKAIITYEVTDQYYNMREKIEPVMHIIDLAREAYSDLDIKPIVKAIRGGTDGARLSFMGLPTPNIFAGGHNFHGKYEFIPLESMIKACEVVIRIAELHALKAK